MSRNVLYVVIALVTAAAAVLGYLYYQSQQNVSTIKIDIGQSGFSIKSN